MTTIEDALAVPANPGLSDFEGLPVRQAGVEIPGAAGGLREAMKIEPQEFHKGETVAVVLDCVVQKIRVDPVDKEVPDGDQRRVHIFRVDGATVVDRGVVEGHLRAQAERIRKAKEEAQGISRLPLEEEDQLQAKHDDGQHAEGLVAGCPACDEEAELEAAGE